MVSYDHSLEVDSRNLRDNWILKKYWRDDFVKCNYRYCSIAANFINNSYILKKNHFN